MVAVLLLAAARRPGRRPGRRADGAGGRVIRRHHRPAGQAEWLTSAGGAGFVTGDGRGESGPLCAETAADGSANPVNRRVEILLTLGTPIPTD